MVVIGALATSAAGQIELRASPQVLSAEVVSITSDGVGITQNGSPATITWDRIRAVRDNRFAVSAGGFADMAEQLWRARTRVERGDYAAAEPLLDAIVSGRSGQVSGPTAAVAFEALLRCRLHRGSVSGAVWAWLDWRRVRPDSGGLKVVGGVLDASPIIDLATGLVPTLPPIFLNDPATSVAAQSDEWSRLARAGGQPQAGAHDDTRATVLATLYHAAAQFDTGAKVQIAPVTSTDAGVRLVADVVLARAGDEAQRAAARAALEARIDGAESDPTGSGAWVECWCRLALGRALLRENDEAQRRLGVIHLLHVPARFARLSPGLAGMALADASAGLHALGDESGAQAVKGELLARYPRQSAANDARLRDIKSPVPDPQPGAASASAADTRTSGGTP